MPKANHSITIDVPTRRGKRPPPKNAFKPGNRHRFQKGHSGNPKGRPRDDESHNAYLVSKALRGFLGVKAPYQIAEKLGLKPGASWAQCLGASIIQRSVAGEIAAARLVLDATEGTRATLGIADPASIAPPSLEVFLISPATGRPEPVITIKERPDQPLGSPKPSTSPTETPQLSGRGSNAF